MLYWLVLYSILVRTPMKECTAVKCVGVTCDVSCYNCNGQSHLVAFKSEAEALRFYNNLQPYNFETTLDKGVPDNKPFIQGLRIGGPCPAERHCLQKVIDGH